MNINKLLIETSNNINKLLDLKNRTKQSIINDNLSNIEALSANGVSYRQLLISGNIPIALKHFHDLIYRAKKKRFNYIEKDKKADLQQGNKSPLLGQNTQKKQSEQPEFDLIEWKMILSDISEILVKDIIKHGYTLEDTKKWIVENKIPNSSVLRRYFNSIRNNKGHL